MLFRLDMTPATSMVFKAYDIRGLSPGEIDANFAFTLGKILASRYHPKRVLVGRDMRLTSSDLEKALIEGLGLSGTEIVCIGLCSTPMFNVLIHLAQGAFDFGVMVTASHNPGKYNGFKITLGDGKPVGQGSGMEEIRDAYLEEVKSGAAKISPWREEASKDFRISDDSQALSRYVEYIIALAKLPAEMPKVKIAIDAGNGMAGAVLPTLLQKLPWLDVVMLYGDPDGNFPHHEANPLKEETLKDLQTTVIREKCVLGVAFDGDADRIGFVDEKGSIVQGDLVTALLAQELLREFPGSKVHADVRSSWSVEEVVKESGGVFSMCRVGHAMIKQLMRQTQAVFAGELSMHFYFRELGNFESGDYVLLLILRQLVRTGKSFSELIAPLCRYAKSAEINFEVVDPQRTIQALKEVYSIQASSVIELDGIRCEFRAGKDRTSDWWFNVRASNTEPLVRLNLEAATPALLAQKLTELTDYIRL